MVKNIDDIYLANDAKTLLYLKNRILNKLDGTNPNAEAAPLTDKNVVQFVAAADGSAVFYVNDDYEMFYQKGAKKPAFVTDDVSYRKDVGSASNDPVFGLFKGTSLFYINDDELFVSTWGKGKRVNGIAGDVRSVNVGVLDVVVVSYDDGEEIVYRSVDGKVFELVW